MIQFKETEERHRYEIMGTAITGNMGTVTIAHPDGDQEAIDAYDEIVGTGQYRNVWIRHRQIVETVRNTTPAGFTVFIKWKRDFDGEEGRHDFLTKAAALAFAEAGNDPGVMTAVYVFDHRIGRTIWEWKA